MQIVKNETACKAKHHTEITLPKPPYIEHLTVFLWQLVIFSICNTHASFSWFVETFLCLGRGKMD